MTGWAIYALIVTVGPMLLVARWLVVDWVRERRQARGVVRELPDWSVAAIRERVEREQREREVFWPRVDLDGGDVGDERPTEILTERELDRIKWDPETQ